jgi:hypothetical protein
MSDLLNILSNSNKDIDNQKLMDYISGKLSEKERHEIEKQMADNQMMNDAVEGLQQFKDQKKLDTYVEQLQKQLNTYIQKKKERRTPKWFRGQYDVWIFISLIVILLLIVIAYIVIRTVAPK